MPKAYYEYRFPNGLIVSRFYDPGGTTDPGEELIEKALDEASKLSGHVTMDVVASNESLAFHRLDEGELSDRVQHQKKFQTPR